MKKTIMAALFLLSLFFIVACQDNNGINTLKIITLSEFEQRIADINNDFVFCFEISKSGLYNINFRYFEKGMEKSLGSGVREIEVVNDQNVQIIICENKVSENTAIWKISADGSVGEFGPIESLTDTMEENYSHYYGSVPSNLRINKQQEYVLAFALFNQKTSISSQSINSILSFPEIQNKQELLSEFDYAYIVTIEQIE